LNSTKLAVIVYIHGSIPFSIPLFHISYSSPVITDAPCKQLMYACLKYVL